MCTSVPQTPARRTRMSTSSSRNFGSGTSFNTNPGPADCLTSAFTGRVVSEVVRRGAFCATRNLIRRYTRRKCPMSARVSRQRQLYDSRNERIVLHSVPLSCARELGGPLEIAVGIHLDDEDPPIRRDAQINARIVAQSERAERLYSGVLQTLGELVVEILREDRFRSSKLRGALSTLAF